MNSLIFAVIAIVIPAEADQTLHFDRIWSTARSQIAPREKSDLFTEDKRIELRRAAKNASSIAELAALVNPFLLSLNVSHTYLYDSKNPDYYMLRSLFTTRDVNEPKLRHVGMQVQKNQDGYVVRNVLEGYPAGRAGIRRGDVMQTSDGREFHPFDSFANSDHVRRVTVLRNGQRLHFKLRPVHEGLHASFLQATRNSVRVIERAGKKIGYIHLWSGTDDSFLQALKDALATKLKETDALILDLRDGFGGAWWNYLDPFYSDSKSYFVATRIDRDGIRSDLKSEVYSNKDPYTKPMVVLINEGVRSGKEALAFQFKKTKRATLVGTATAGVFVGGKGHFADENEDYILFLSNFEMLLDGQRIEGVSVQPDVLVESSLAHSSSEDSQLLKAIELAI